jgi:hypothetical protein
MTQSGHWRPAPRNNGSFNYEAFWSQSVAVKIGPWVALATNKLMFMT